MDGFWQAYFLQSGVGWAAIGAMLAVMFGGWGSANGIRIAAGQAGGVLSEKPELFGKLFALMVLPGTLWALSQWLERRESDFFTY